MGFTPKYTQAQRRAIARLMLDEGKTGPEVVRMAAAGEIDDFGSFTVPRNTAYYLADVERRRRQARIDADLATTPKGKLVVAHRRAVALAEREIRRLECRGKKNGVDPVRLQRLSNTLANLIRVQPSSPAPQAPDPPKPVSGTLEERLAQVEAEEAARREQEEASQEAAESVEAPDPEPPASPKKPSLTDLRLDTSPPGQRAYAERLRELGIAEETINTMLKHQEG